MNKIDTLLDTKSRDILSIYFTAGYPKLDNTSEIIHELEMNKVDLIEIGIPFSDPVADGPVIQFSNSAALENGMTLKCLFDQLKEIKTKSTIPKILMGYFNPILKFGLEAFCKNCMNVGVDGVIIPDLPIYEYEKSYQKLFQKYGIHFIFLVTPQTSTERLTQIDRLTTGFVYAVSTNSTTGMGSDFDLQQAYFQNLKEQIKSPFLIGFGVHNQKTFTQACDYAQGAIVGSAFIKAISDPGDLKGKTKDFIHQIKN